MGNNTTTPVDLLDEGDVLRTLCVLVESVTYRLRKLHLQGRVVHVRAVDTDLGGYGRQGTLSHPTQLSDTILKTALGLFRASFPWTKPVHNVGVTVSGLTSLDSEQQLSFLPEVAREARAYDWSRPRMTSATASDTSPYQLASVNQWAICLGHAESSDFDDNRGWS